MIDVSAIMAWILIILGFAGFYATYKFRSWWLALRPSRLLGALYAVAASMDVAALPLIFLSARRLLYPDAETLDYGILLLGISIIILLGVKIVEVIAFRDLDHAVKANRDPELETQNQREDRQFGKKRRALEATHKKGKR